MIDLCVENPEFSYIILQVAGNDTIYSWRCTAGVPEITRTVAAVDGQGFVVGDWRPVPR